MGRSKPLVGEEHFTALEILDALEYDYIPDEAAMDKVREKMVAAWDRLRSDHEIVSRLRKAGEDDYRIEIFLDRCVRGFTEFEVCRMPSKKTEQLRDQLSQELLGLADRLTYARFVPKHLGVFETLLRDMRLGAQELSELELDESYRFETPSRSKMTWPGFIARWCVSSWYFGSGIIGDEYGLEIRPTTRKDLRPYDIQGRNIILARIVSLILEKPYTPNQIAKLIPNPRNYHRELDQE